MVIRRSTPPFLFIATMDTDTALGMGLVTGSATGLACLAEFLGGAVECLAEHRGVEVDFLLGPPGVVEADSSSI